MVDHSSNMPNLVPLFAEAEQKEGCLASMAASHLRVILCKLEKSISMKSCVITIVLDRTVKQTDSPQVDRNSVSNCRYWNQIQWLTKAHHVGKYGDDSSKRTCERCDKVWFHGLNCWSCILRLAWEVHWAIIVLSRNVVKCLIQVFGRWCSVFHHSIWMFLLLIFPHHLGGGMSSFLLDEFIPQLSFAWKVNSIPFRILWN